MKYLVVHDGELDVEFPLLFSELLNHAMQFPNPNCTIVSGGYAVRHAGTWKAMGKLDSLGVWARPKDADLLNQYFGGL